MMNQTYLFISSGLLIFWGIAHLFPTRSVIGGFGNISADNRRIITMEWINEGITLMFIGATVLLVSVVDYTSKISVLILWADFFVLNVLSLVSLCMGFRIKYVPFRLCPVIFTASSVLILAGIYA